jgi:hypothetical protein
MDLVLVIVLNDHILDNGQPDLTMLIIGGTSDRIEEDVLRPFELREVFIGLRPKLRGLLVRMHLAAHLLERLTYLTILRPRLQI